MPRSLRIEYENAYYHVMKSRAKAAGYFLSQDYSDAFLSTLEEAHRRFGMQSSVTV